MDLQLFAQEPTEEATPRRREESRKRGQVFKSQELVGALTLLSVYLTLRYFGAYMGGRLLLYAQNLWEGGVHQDWSEGAVRLLLLNMFLVVVLVVAPVLLGSLVSGLVGNYLQVGFLFTFEPLIPKFERIDPFAGAKRLFSRRALVELAKSLVKITIIGYVAYSTVAGDLDQFPMLLNLEPQQVVVFLAELVMRMILWVGMSMLVMALLDYFYQRWEYEKSIRMTKQQIKEELRQTEGNPEIRSRIRQKQREIARRRMMQDVKKASVVVTNPTHYAVALEYRRDEMGAPKVLAKGQGFIALRIRELAGQSRIPIVENPPLARQLHKGVEIGQEVPADLFQAVAEVLAFVYQLKQKGY